MALINKEQEYQDQEAWSNDVQKLKGYKELVEKVEYWANKKDNLGNLVIWGSYEIVYDDELGWCADIDGHVDFYKHWKIKEIPFQFRNVNGSFSCLDCKNLTSLKGCPIFVGGYFNCSGCNKLTSLEDCPKEVGSNFYCFDCDENYTIEYVQSLCKVKGIIKN